MNDEMRQWLGAYLDGELDPEECQAVRDCLEKDTEARDYLNSIRRLNDSLSMAYDPLIYEPTPAGIKEVVYPRRRDWVKRALPLALAASLGAIAVLLVQRSALDDELQGQLAQIQSQMALLRAQTLENVPSGKVASWSVSPGKARIEVMPVRSYRTPDARFCREYEERFDGGQGVEVRRGVACRSGKAEWADLRAGML